MWFFSFRKVIKLGLHHKEKKLQMAEFRETSLKENSGYFVFLNQTQGKTVL